MATKNKAEKSAVSKPKKATILTQPLRVTGNVVGLYSTSIYNDGELVDFIIDWDKLKEHVKSV